MIGIVRGRNVSDADRAASLALERLGILSYRNNVVILEDPLDLCLIVTPTKNPVPSSARYSTEPFRNFKIVPSALIIGCQRGSLHNRMTPISEKGYS